MMVYYRLKNGEVLKRIVFIWLMLSGFVYGSLYVQPLYRDDIEVLQSLDVNPSFLRDPLFIQLKNGLATKKKMHYFQMLERGSLYIPTLRKMIHDNNIPQVFLYMAMAESHFKTNAYSRAKASGLWQFMPKTAKIYGLKIDQYIDERRDPVRSTEAAIAYLKKLHKLFGKWYLAALAYNSGEGRVIKAIERAGSDELQVLLDEKKHYLPRESRNYIRKIVSLALIANDPDMFTTKAHAHMFNRGEGKTLVRVKVSGGETLEHIASQIGMSVSDMKKLNPQFKYGFTPPQKGAFINIPYERLAYFKQFYKPGRQNKMFFVHTVKKGDTLGAIARKYGISYKMIQRFNKMRNAVIYPKQTLIIPVPRRESIYYKVKKGDSIYKIARLFNVKVERIKERNGLKNNIIHEGDNLVIPN